MNKFIITLVVVALSLGTFAQNNDEMTERRKSRERGRIHERNGNRPLDKFSSVHVFVPLARWESRSPL